MARKSKGRSNVIEVDFTGVEAGGRVTPEGEYVVEVLGVERKMSEADKPYLAWTLKVVGDPNHEGNRLYYNTSLQKQALWNLRQFLEAMGIETQGGAMQLDLKSYVGLQLGVEVDIEEYKGKDKSRVVDVFALNDDEDEDEDDDEEAEDEEASTNEEDEEEDEEESEEDSDEGEDDDEDESDEGGEDEEDEEEEEPTPRRRRSRARR